MAANPQVITRIGRVRVTRVVSPSEANYIGIMRAQADQIAGKIQEIVNRFENVLPEAIIFGLQPVFDRSQELVPVLTGKLKASGYLEVTQNTKGHKRVEIGYAKHGQPHYAAFIHEMLHLRHAKGKSAKYLEKAVQEKLSHMQSRMIQFMKAQTGLN